MTRPPPRWGGLRVVLAALVAAVTILGPPVGAAPTGVRATGVTIEASPRWGPVPPSAWTPYRVMLGNQGGADVDGEVVLVPRSEPPPQPGERPSPPTTTLPTSSTVLALGGRGMTAPAPRGPAGTTEIPEWPTYRA
ncbi:MAG TPA: hypothetical protein VK988_22785, partial [Acidimicrobiales bacterium]|nr:hypothetical protein [Acidimicrobiales bacterium]